MTPTPPRARSGRPISCPAVVIVALIVNVGFAEAVRATDPLPSWNDGPTKQAILEFVEALTDEDGERFVSSEERIAVFDHDGTLWSEKPVYFQLQFALDRLRESGGNDAKSLQPALRDLLDGDDRALAKDGARKIMQVVMASHAGTTNEEYERIVAQWLAKARHPRFDKPYTQLVYQPMLEVLAYLRANGFETYIVSGGGVEFIRTFAEKVYGIPPDHVVGSSVAMRFEMRDGEPVVVRLPKVDFVNNEGGKPVGIEKFIGRRPIAAFGNSDGDLQMLQWTTIGRQPSLGVIVHHTDAEREWAYDRDSLVGRLDEALDQAGRRGWTVVDMKRDWRVVYPWESSR